MGIFPLSAESEEGAGAVWRDASAAIKDKLAVQTFHTWFEPIKAIGITDTELALEVPSKFAKNWIEPRYMPLISSSVSVAAGRNLEIQLHPAKTLEDAGDTNMTPPLHLAPVTDVSFLNPSYAFDTYVIGASNRFAHAASLAVAEAPAKAYNPLFIYGGVGLGKTHLLHAIGHLVLQTRPSATVRYISTEQFTNEFIASVGDPGRIAGFKKRFRNTDVLLVDDIQFLENKEATIEEFFHTFNTLHNASKQIVLTSDRPPKELGLVERLRSRFEGGLITDVQPPDLETRIAILRRKADFDGVGHVSSDVLAYIASQVESNIRELEGALTRVVAFASLDRSNVSVELAARVLVDLYPGQRHSAIAPEVIIAETARYFGFTPDDIGSERRDRTLVHARHLAMYLCRWLTDLSLPQIGQRFGGRDHSTVMHAYSKIQRQMAEQAPTYNQIQELASRVQSRAKNL